MWFWLYENGKWTILFLIISVISLVQPQVTQIKYTIYLYLFTSYSIMKCVNPMLIDSFIARSSHKRHKGTMNLNIRQITIYCKYLITASFWKAGKQEIRVDTNTNTARWCYIVETANLFISNIWNTFKISQNQLGYKYKNTSMVPGTFSRKHWMPLTPAQHEYNIIKLKIVIM